MRLYLSGYMNRMVKKRVMRKRVDPGRKVNNKEKMMKAHSSISPSWKPYPSLPPVCRGNHADDSAHRIADTETKQADGNPVAATGP